MVNEKTNLTTQHKLILTGLVSGTVLIVLMAFYTIFNIQQKLELNYSKFGQMLTKTLAIESADFLYDAKLAQRTNSILSANPDIAFIDFVDPENRLLYSSKLSTEKESQSVFRVSSPIVKDNKQIGAVTVGLSGVSIKEISKATKNSILLMFTAMWLVFSLVVLINTFLITRELRLLQYGVRKISGGKFGYQLDGESTSGEVRELIASFNDMSARLHTYDAQNIDELTLERNKFEAVLMNVANGVVVCDRFDTVVLVNNIAHKILETAGEQLLNTKIHRYCDENGAFCFEEKIEQFKNTPLDISENKPVEFNVEISSKVLKAIITPMFSKAQDYLGYIIVLIDITKEVEVDKLKSNFISNVSHELRTPVTILRSYIDTLHNHGEDFDDATKKEFLQILDNEAARLHGMVNDILDFSRFESAETELEKLEINICDLIERVVNSMVKIAEEKSLQISVVKQGKLPDIALNCDSIERVLQNLISNAIKYSPQNGKVEVASKLVQDNKYVQISVKDDGIGIASEYKEKVFERFFRVENDTHAIKGTGLGLYLVKVAVEKHHQGKVFVESELGKGSTFFFELPLVSVDEKQPSVIN